jgi:branched-chain amino acid transport system ATP-binding protein
LTLEVRGISKRYGGVRALRSVSFAVSAGERVALIGPNGAGKTTCFNVLNGQVHPDDGDVLLDGRSVAGLPPRAIWRRGVGRTFQVTQTFGSMTVRENVQVALLSVAGELGSPFRLFKDQQAAEADALLARIGMAEQAERRCAILSYGDLKRVELALALASRPRVLLMDEPTAGMAATERAELMRLAVEVAERERLALLFTEHDMDVVFGFATRVLVLNEGELIAAGTPEAVRTDRKVQEVYLGSA